MNIYANAKLASTTEQSIYIYAGDVSLAVLNGLAR